MLLRCRSCLQLQAPASAIAESLPPPWLPKKPGTAHCVVDSDGARLFDDAIAISLAARDGALQPDALENRFTGRTRPLKGEFFTVTLRADKSKRLASQFRLEGALACRPVIATAAAARAADRRAGQSLEATLVDATSGLRVRWRMLLRDGSNYVRQELEFSAPKGADLSRCALIELDLPDSRVLGSVSGSPIVTDEAFFGFEHPMAEARVIGGHASMRLRRALPLRPDVAARYSAVFGAAPTGQLRRGFQAYLENERAAPFRTFLHYNSWYDIGYFTPYTETEALSVVRAYGDAPRQGTRRADGFLPVRRRLGRHVATVAVQQGLPSGFAPLRDATAKIGAAPGVWLSPWGGYGPPREARLATARAAGFEVDEQGLALSGPRYFALFHDTTVNLLRRYGINQFKLDGTGSADKVTPDSEFDSDFAAAIALIGDLRAIKPDLFINLHDRDVAVAVLADHGRFDLARRR